MRNIKRLRLLDIEFNPDLFIQEDIASMSGFDQSYISIIFQNKRTIKKNETLLKVRNAVLRYGSIHGIRVKTTTAKRRNAA